MENRHLRDQRRSSQSIDGFFRRPGQQLASPRPRPVHSSAIPPVRKIVRPAPEPVVDRLSRQDMELPGEAGRRRLKYRKPHRLRRWTFRSATALLVVVLLIGGYLFSKGYLQLHRVFTGGSSAAALNSDVNPDQLKGEGSGRVNILLLGIGGPGHDGADLTDTIIVASVDVVNHKMGLLSIPRDLWVKEPNNYMSNYGKINAAYESGKYHYLGMNTDSNKNIKAIKAGFQAADQTVSSIIGIPINYNVLVNFHAFEQAVNAVGGVTVNVPEELYDPTMAWQNNWNPVLAKKGVQHMNGYHALLYARSRETSSDFARSARQRAILLALKSKILTAGTLSNPIKLSNLMDALGDNVRSDISLSDMDQLYNIMKDIPSKDIKSVDLDKEPNNFITTGSLDGQSIVEPKAGLFEYGDIQSFVRNTLRDGYLTKENAKVLVLNGTSDPGLATNEVKTLKSYGYHVAAPANAPSHNRQVTLLVDLTNGRDKYTKHYLERRLNINATTKLPTGISPGGANFVIILGQDEAENG